MKIRLLCYSSLVALGLLGCGKSHPPGDAAKPSPETSAPSTPAASEPATPPPPPAPGAEPAAAANAGTSDVSEPGLADLNRAVGAYVMGQLKSPATLEDLVKAGMIKRLPTAPAGKKYALDASKTRVVLVDR